MADPKKILVTGGTGYIGSHTVVVLMQAGYEVVILDNLCNSTASVVDQIQRITGLRPVFVEGDVRDKELVWSLLQQHGILAVVHFAGLKAVGESVAQPLRYYDCNVFGSVALCEAMAEADVKTLIFSSSATVYGDPATVPVREDFPTNPANPYGRSKLIVEEILGDLYQSDNAWSIGRLRYFNPVGAHESGMIGEAPSGVPNNLMPYIAQVAIGQRKKLSVYGNDYPTPDGTGIRDYIHVVDLAEGHLAALRYLQCEGGLLTVNLGTGKACSVLEMVAAFERAIGRALPYEIVARRPGDIAEYWADPALASKLLDWATKRDVDAMCRDTWRWQQFANQA
jgi:UDP-glucose 4-epimerase